MRQHAKTRDIFLDVRFRFGAALLWHGVHAGSLTLIIRPVRIDIAVSSFKAVPAATLVVTCRSGGIGRRAWFRSMYPQGCGGSSPFFGTNEIQTLCGVAQGFPLAARINGR